MPAAVVCRCVRVLSAMLVLFATSTAFAQDEKPLGPYYDVPTLEFRTPYVQWIFLALFVVILLLVAFKNPHRSHLD